MRSRPFLPVLLALALAEGALAGCAGRPARPPAPAFSRQEEGVRAAGRSLARGRLQDAIAAQQRALLAARSVEDEEGIALRILDLATLHRAAGEPLQAAAALGELLAEPPPLPYPGRWRAEAARLAGLLALDAGNADGGAQWAARALELCAAVKCSGRGIILNLQARAAHLAGDQSRAIRLAQEALALHRGADAAGARADASRILADAELARGRHQAAARAYAASLEIDKKLGLDAKLFLDLVGLGTAARDGGRPREALGWYGRARAVALASGDLAGASAVEELVRALPPPAP